MLGLQRWGLHYLDHAQQNAAVEAHRQGGIFQAFCFWC
jgi:hypothetical protein